MSTLTIAIIRHLSIVFVATLLVMIASLWMINTWKFFELINYDFSWVTMAKMVLFPMPRFLAIIIGPVTFLTTLAVYAKMDRHGEITAMRAGGLSSFSIASPALIFTTAIILLSYGLTLYGMPWGYRQFKQTQIDLKHSYSPGLIRADQFITLGSKITFYARKTSPELVDIFIYDGRGDRQPQIITAKRGIINQTATGLRLSLFDGSRQTLDEKSQFSLLDFERYTFDLKQPLIPIFGLKSNPDALYLDDLIAGAKTDQRLLAQTHYRLGLPLLNLHFTILALLVILFYTVPRQPHFILLSLTTLGALLMYITTLGLIRWAEVSDIGLALFYVVLLTPAWAVPLALSKAHMKRHDRLA